MCLYTCSNAERYLNISVGAERHCDGERNTDRIFSPLLYKHIFTLQYQWEIIPSLSIVKT